MFILVKLKVPIQNDAELHLQSNSYTYSSRSLEERIEHICDARGII